MEHDYFYTITTRSYYRVKAESRDEADQKLEDCEDLGEIFVSEESGEPEFYGSTDPKGDKNG